MIVSVSRRTDIPAFYTEWFMNRIRDGYCVWPHPYNRNKKYRLSLSPEDVDVLVFWRNTRPPSWPASTNWTIGDTDTISFTR